MTNYYYAALFINSLFTLHYIYQTIARLIECIRDKDLNHHIPYIVLPNLLFTIIFASTTIGAYLLNSHTNNTKNAISILLLPFAFAALFGTLAIIISTQKQPQ